MRGAIVLVVTLILRLVLSLLGTFALIVSIGMWARQRRRRMQMIVIRNWHSGHTVARP